MNNKRKIVLGLGALMLILGINGVISGTAEAYRGDPTIKGPSYTAGRHALMEKAFETNDYTAWKNLMANKGRVTEVINKDNFAKFAEAHELAEKGDKAGAAKIKADLGLGLKNGSSQGQRNGVNRGINKGNYVNR